MHSYVIIHHTQQAFEVALFINNAQREHIIEDKRLTSKLLITLLDNMLTKHNITINKLSFLGINQGPGLFSTLRSIIATTNGLHFATHIPLIGIDALDATALEFYDAQFPYTVTLLNACNREVYYNITHHKNILLKGYDTIDNFLRKIGTDYSRELLHFIGDGTTLYKELIQTNNAIHAYIPETIPQICSINTIAQMTLTQYTNGQTSSYLFPLHLKKHPVEK